MPRRAPTTERVAPAILVSALLQACAGAQLPQDPPEASGTLSTTPRDCDDLEESLLGSHMPSQPKVWELPEIADTTQVRLEVPLELAAVRRPEIQESELAELKARFGCEGIGVAPAAAQLAAPAHAILTCWRQLSDWPACRGIPRGGIIKTCQVWLIKSADEVDVLRTAREIRLFLGPVHNKAEALGRVVLTLGRNAWLPLGQEIDDAPKTFGWSPTFPRPMALMLEAQQVGFIVRVPEYDPVGCDHVLRRYTYLVGRNGLVCPAQSEQPVPLTVADGVCYD